MFPRVNRRGFLKSSAAEVAAFSAVLSLAPGHTSATNTSVARIDELRQAFNNAYSAGNAAATGCLLEEDAVWMPQGEPAVVGRSSIQARYAAQFSTTHSSFTLNRGGILVLANLAFLRGGYQCIDTPARAALQRW